LLRLLENTRKFAHGLTRCNVRTGLFAHRLHTIPLLIELNKNGLHA
jgi:hypothetical protein